MADYRVVCTVQHPPHQRGHIIQVGTGHDPNQADRFWTVEEVVTAMRLGNTFFTVSPSTGTRAGVERWDCPAHGEPHLRSTPDAVTDNNLDSLRLCRPRQ